MIKESRISINKRIVMTAISELLWVAPAHNRRYVTHMRYMKRYIVSQNKTLDFSVEIHYHYHRPRLGLW